MKIWWPWWWWRENNRNVVVAVVKEENNGNVVVVVEENNRIVAAVVVEEHSRNLVVVVKENYRILWPSKLYQCATCNHFLSLNSAPEEFCSVGEKSFSRKDSMQRHVMSKHRNVGLTPFQTVPFSQKCQRFRFEHPFTSMIAGMTGSGKTAWIRSLLQQASETIYPPLERVVWCYSQWQPAYTEMLVAMSHIESVKGIPTALEQDFFDF